MKTGNIFFQQVNPNVLKAQYAVRGAVPTKAGEIDQDLKKNPHKYPFNQITYCNIGNPQAFKQPPISFNRQVISCVLNPALMDSKEIHQDVKDRAKIFLDSMISAGSYTHSMGAPVIRHSVAKFIEKKDKVPRPSIDDISLTEGASQGVHLLFRMLICNKNDGIMIPIPQYPLYSGAIALNGGTVVPYYLDEQSGWQLKLQELENSYNKAKANGTRVRCLAVINPGNPTGAIFNEQTIKNIIKFSVEKKVMLIADEVYRENIYKQGVEFLSFRAVLNRMEPQYQQNCELASLHSVSKGLIGECELRGGYLYLHNFSQTIKTEFTKLKSINLCSNTIGQMSVEMMCNPPVEGVSEETKKKYLDETKVLFDALKIKAKLVTTYLNSMKNIHCQEVQGSMYAFPSIKFSDQVIKISQGKPDLFYCMEVLKNTGIVIIPGSGFKQREGTYHFRITILIRPVDKFQQKLKSLKQFNDKFHAKYEDKGKL